MHVLESGLQKAVKVATGRAGIDADIIPGIAQLQEVLWIEEWTAPEIANNQCQWVGYSTNWCGISCFGDLRRNQLGIGNLFYKN